MKSNKLYDILFQLYDYADYLVGEIGPNNTENNNYFMSLIYIEDMMDKYGRGLINKAAHDMNNADTASLKEAHQRLDSLRQNINTLKTKYDFNGVVTQRAEVLIRDWDRGGMK